MFIKPLNLRDASIKGDIVKWSIVCMSMRFKPMATSLARLAMFCWPPALASAHQPNLDEAELQLHNLVGHRSGSLIEERVVFWLMGVQADVSLPSTANLCKL